MISTAPETDDMTDKLKVLYVDDEPLLTMAFVETLKIKGYQARGALNGEECLEKVKEECPDIIILDIMMKPMSGWDILLKIAEDENIDGVLIIMQTGKSLTLQDALTYGKYIDDYMVKPVKFPDMILAIERLLKRNQEIEEEIKKARKSGISENILSQYASLKRQVIINDRLLEVLSRIYPIMESREPGINVDIPDLKKVQDTFTTTKTKFRAIQSQMY